MVQYRGKKNGEIIERAEKKQRYRFQHKAYRKPQKKIKSRDSIQYTPL